MGGIEFYPQKEFDDDMEDKSDNDKIRVSSPGLSHPTCSSRLPCPSSPYNHNYSPLGGMSGQWGIVWAGFIS